MDQQLGLFDEPSWMDGMTDNAKTLCAYLQGKGRVAGKRIQADLGWDEKTLRDVRAETGGAILSGPGSPGYTLILEATVEDFDRIIAARRGMLKSMDHDTTAMIRFFHSHRQAS